MSEAEIMSFNKKLLDILNDDTKKYNISVANKLFGEQTFTFKQVTQLLKYKPSGCIASDFNTFCTEYFP